MKLLRYGSPGQEKPGILAPDGEIRDLSGHVSDHAGAALLPEAIERLRNIDIATLPRVSGRPRMGPCVGKVGKFVCIGLNYSDHAAESGMPVPVEPVIFMKATSCISGPDDAIVMPRGSKKTDWEVELGVVIGRVARYVSKAHALDHVAGFALINDYSEREYQLERGGQWDKGKGCDTFAPFGPFIATADTIDSANLKMWLKVNGEQKQDGNTSDMIFDVPTVVSYISAFMTLLPGDIISTGTPPGVGAFAKPPRFLNAGDVVELGIAGLGTSRQRVVAPTER
jgi:2-keto-4-pentenoate hydratase/2-oxohepta-3-ene-1,7-dioic acid hydratase in catechol pathway